MRPGRGGGGSSRVPSVHFADPSLARDTLNTKLCRYNHPYRLLYHICNALYPNCMFHVTRHTDPRLGEGPLCTDCVSRLASTLQQVPLDVLSRGYFPQVILRPSPPDYYASPGEGFYIYAPSVLILPTRFRNN